MMISVVCALAVPTRPTASTSWVNVRNISTPSGGSEAHVAGPGDMDFHQGIHETDTLLPERELAFAFRGLGEADIEVGDAILELHHHGGCPAVEYPRLGVPRVELQFELL